MGGWFKKEIGSLADMQGLKMRIPGIGGQRGYVSFGKESAKGKNTEEVSKALKGQPNTDVELLIERPYMKEPFIVNFKRQKITRLF